MEESADMVQPRLIGALLRIPFQATVTQVHAAVSAAGYDDLRPPHLVPFQHLRRGGAHVADLAERAQMTRQAMAYLVDYLEAHGYVERTPDPDDRRAKLVRLTTRGYAIERIARARLTHLEGEWARQLGAARMQQLHAMLTELAAVVESGEWQENDAPLP